MDLNKEHLEILNHTLHRASGQRYCGDSKEMQDLVAAGFMKSIGKPSFCIDEFFTITPTGKIALSGEIQILLNKQKEAKQCPKCKGELPPDGICICQELHELLDNEMDPEAALANGKPEGVL